jgi:lipopolysaccharide/colanic/teichoic acid biosynthesis glycosyltransferase
MMKRLMDIVLSGLALLVFSPLLIPVVIGLRLTGEGEVFYRQDRVGKGGKPFKLLKFATMLKDSPNLGSGLLTTRGDPRVLPMGKFLRQTKLNELPQLINIFLGDMSIIGRRPQTQSHVDMIDASVRNKILQDAPGLSGVGSIIFRDEESILTNSPKGHARCFAEDIQPYKGQLELWYCEHQSVWLDIQLIVLTLAAIFSSESKLHLKWLHDLPEPPAALKGFV